LSGTEPTLWGTAIHPDEGLHTWTVEVRPGGVSGKYVEQVWVDGEALKLYDGEEGCYPPSPCAKEVSKEVTPNDPEDKPVLTYAMREPGSGINGFTSGSNAFTIRSVAIYEDKAHEG